jgi:hypothetical protein
MAVWEASFLTVLKDAIITAQSSKNYFAVFSLFTNSSHTLSNFARIMNMRLLLAFSLLLACSALSAQQTDEQLATQYYANNEFDKAAALYEKLNSRNPSSVYF